MNLKIKPISFLIFALLPFAATAAENNDTQSITENTTQDHSILTIQTLTVDNDANLINEETPDSLEDVSLPGGDELANDIVQYASTHLGTPYRWGATGSNSFDCSGFVGHVFRNFDIKLNRTSRQQFLQGERVNVKDIRPGDLMFFAGRNGGSRVSHVGMAVEVLPDGRIKFIHAATRQGVIYNVYPSDRYYGKRFLGARRMIPENA